MGLENLKSIFTEGIDGNASNYQQGQPQGSDDTKLFKTPPQPTAFIATNPTDFSTAGIGLTSYSPFTTPHTPYPATSFDSDLLSTGNHITFDKLFL